MNLSRQSGILPRSVIEKSQVTLIGAGAIGSWTAIILTKMGVPKITIYDNDVVSPENPSLQNYRPQKDLGKKKVDALKEILEDFSTSEVIAIPELFTGKIRPKGYVISAVDSMDARIEIWNNSIRYNLNVPLYIEARMGAEELRVYSVNPMDIKEVQKYETFLYPSSKAFHAPCTAKAIAYTPSIAAGIIGRELKAHLTGEGVAFENILGLKSRMWVV